MRRGHRGTGDGALKNKRLARATHRFVKKADGVTHGGSGPADPGAQDRGTRGKDVDDGPVVGEAGAGVAGGGGADGADGGFRGGRRVGGVGVLVAGGDGEEDSGADEGGGGAVDGRGAASAEGHVGDDTVGARAGAGVRGDEVHAGDDAGAIGRVSTRFLFYVGGGRWGVCHVR